MLVCDEYYPTKENLFYVEQTNDCFDSGNLQSKLHKMKSSELRQSVSRYILLQMRVVVPVKTRSKKKMEVFCGFFTGKPPVKNPPAGQTSDFHASCGKISMVNFRKK